jgi:hypothetical protein
MSLDRWSSERDPDVLGVLVHGPAVIARSAGIVMAVRCIFARPGGLELDLMLRAAGVQAEAASRQTFGKHDPLLGLPDQAEDGWRGGSEPELFIEVDGRRAIAYPHEQSSGGGDDHFDSEMRVVIAGLPSDGVITLTSSWPEAGLAEGSLRLTLDSLDDLENRVIRLP